jgi:hypothetical protein
MKNTNLHPRVMPRRKHKSQDNAELLKGWKAIADYLGQPVTVVQRWATEGMPARRQGRYVEATSSDLNAWLGCESAGEPVQIATKDIDLGSELKRGLSFARKHRKRNAT